MSELTTTSPEIDQQPINPNEDIQSLVGNVDISSFDEKLAPILANPTTKELLLKELKENQPLTSGLMLNRIIRKIKDAQVAQKDAQVAQKDAQVAQKEIQSEKINNKFLDQAKLATAEVTNAFSAIEKSISADKKTEISSQISTQLADIKNGNIPDETKKFLNQIGANTPESITSPEVLSILTAHISTRVYLENKDSILKINPELGEQFANLDRNKYALGISGKIEAKDIGRVLTDIPKSDKDTVISTVNSLTKGAPDTLITRSGDRLTWEDKSGSKYEIDMAVRPPRLTKLLGSLSLSRTEHEENPEVKTLQQDIESNKKELNTTKGEASKSLENSGVYGFNPDNYTPDELRKMFSGVEIGTFEQKLNDAKTTEQQISLKEELKNNREGSGGKLNKVAIQYMEYILDERIQMGNSGIEGISSMDTVSSKDWMEKLTSLKEFKSSNKLEEYAKEKESLEKKEKKLGEIKSPNIEDFDTRAEDTLRKLDSLGFDKIGQENLNALIRGLGARDNNVGIWESGEINMDDSIVREAQLKDLEQVAQSLKKERANNPNTKDENSLENVFSDISKMLKGNDAFRNLWNSPNGLASWIKKQGVQNETPNTNSNKINTLK